ncbi:Transmembrane and ubiquitin-like domain-containing protein 2 [Pseudolycoriella hygida]|uniref:Transmembrane and ubiquitin-like domain-containing protein 2 n=1 Tax=Pseudolycoriella hygida TaxID=35572 RepID=A0A9Q0MWE0_9DIPT|nr:Transmembrane and ubiquitin-like domain-containing protein 2 [Pseudolycoriella hygida]
MSLIEGIGDEVSHWFFLIFLSIVLYFAWRSTNVRDERIPRNLIIIESNRQRLLGRVAQNPITISILHSTSQQSTVTNDIDDINTEDESITSEDTETNAPTSLHIEEAPTLEAILDEVGELTAAGTFAQRNRDREQIEIIREMDRDDTDGIRHRRTAAQTNSTENDVATSATPSAQTSTNFVTASKSRLNHQDSTDKAANTENCTNENSENGNVFEDLPYESSVEAAAATAVATPVESIQQIESKESEFRIKLKYLNDDLKLVKGCPNEFIGDFKKRNFTDELSCQKVVRLVFNGHVLQPDTKTLKACGLFDNCVVHCLVHNPRPYSNLTASQGNNLNEQENNLQDGIITESGNASAESINAGQRLLFVGMFLICLTLVFCWYFRYKISIFRDTTPLQIFYEYVSIAFRWFMRLIRSDFIVSGIQAFLLLTPILVIVGAHYFNARRQEGGFKSNLNREYESDEVHEESVASDIEDETLEYRRILNVGPDASPQDVVRAFRQMALVLHPDKNVDLSEEDRLRREEEFKKCHSAKTALLKAILESGTQVS